MGADRSSGRGLILTGGRLHRTGDIGTGPWVFSKSRIKTKNSGRSEGREHRVLYRRDRGAGSLGMLLWRVWWACCLRIRTDGPAEMPDAGRRGRGGRGSRGSPVVLPSLWSQSSFLTTRKGSCPSPQPSRHIAESLLFPG